MAANLSSIILLFIPLLSFIFLALFGKKLNSSLSGKIGCIALSLVTLLSIFVAYSYFHYFGKVDGVYTLHEDVKFIWLQFTDNLSIDLGILLDPISVMMLLVISIVSLMVHIFSLGYMHGEERFSTYFAYLSLFTFSMLGLVLSINLFQMYIFWELVGISSYLLIGFYFTKPSAISAAKKAFIVTRFADLGFLIGILILSYGAQTLDISTLIQRLTEPGSQYLANFAGTSFIGMSVLSFALLLVFVGGAGKSAMFPLHIWLPDAMEGPTPVSALIHAATMVVAGVYLVARLFPIYSISAPDVLEVIAWVGVLSALLAAIIACTQTDIKRVLAYSTISQIGFMMFALGVARWGEGVNEGFTASMFHLFTHAFFKALLFLGAGVVIHTIHSNEMNDMGGLRKMLPVTHITFLLACLAIAGIPPFSGFFSKEAILSSAFSENKAIFYVALFTSALTSFYMFRLYFKIFWGKQTNNFKNHEKGMLVMLLPLIILTIGAVFSGFVPFGNFVSASGKEVTLPVHLIFSIVPVTMGILAIGIACLLYGKESTASEKITTNMGFAYRWVYNKFYFDEVYLFVTNKMIFNLIGRPSAWFDKNIVDGIMNGFATTSVFVSNRIKNIQSGNLQSYTMYFLGGIVAIVLLLLYFEKVI
jgi:NADH-quinone oxidoreductase subunit L